MKSSSLKRWYADNSTIYSIYRQINFIYKLALNMKSEIGMNYLNERRIKELNNNSNSIIYFN